MKEIFPDNFYTDSKSTYVADENRILGLARLRQVRVRSDSCVVPLDFRQEIKFCFADWASSTEDKKAYGPYAAANTNQTNDTA